MSAAEIKIGVHAVSWNTPRGDAVEPWLDEVVAAGYQGVALFAVQLSDHAAEPERLRDLLTMRRLPIVAVTAPLGQSDAEAEQMLAFMASFEIPILASVDNEAGTELAAFAQRLNARGRLAASHGVRLLYHNRRGGAAATQSQLETLAAVLDPACAGLMLDIGHATRDFDEGTPADRAAAFLERHLDRIEYLEFKDFNQVTDLNTPLGEGVADFPRIIELVQQRGYRQWIVVEQNGNLGNSLGRRPFDCALLSRHFLCTYNL